MKQLSESTKKEILDFIYQKYGKKLLFFDIDGVIADFDKQAILEAGKLNMTVKEFLRDGHYRSIKDFYIKLEPMEGAIELIENLKEHFEIIFLSAPSWGNENSFTDKRIWIEKYFGEWSKKRLELTFQKGERIGHFLVDDRLKYDVADFIGEHLHYGTEKFKNLNAVYQYLMKNK